MRISDWSSDVCSSDLWSGTLVMVGQPAEEMGLGAVAMLKDGLYTRFPKPDYTLAFHDTPELPSGVVGAAKGWRSEERRVGKSVSVRVDLGGRRIIKTKTHKTKRDTIPFKSRET